MRAYIYGLQKWKAAFPEKAVATVEEARVNLHDILCFQAPVLASWQHKCRTVLP